MLLWIFLSTLYFLLLFHQTSIAISTTLFINLRSIRRLWSTRYSTSTFIINSSYFNFFQLICYSHLVSHGDDWNMITTILVFELTVTSRQRMTVKTRCLYIGTSLGSPDTGRKKREAKWLAGTPKRKWGPLPVSGNR